MKFFSLRLWHRLCSLSLVMMVAMGGLWFLPRDSQAQLFILPLAGVIASVALLGAWQGFLMVRQRLEFGCPQCNRNARVVASSKKVWHLDCPKCGDLQVHTGWFSLRVMPQKNKRAKPAPRR